MVFAYDDKCFIFEVSRIIRVSNILKINKMRRIVMKWDTPEYNDIRFGFEVTMYINNK